MPAARTERRRFSTLPAVTLRGESTSSTAITLTSDGQMVISVNPDSDRIALVDVGKGVLIGEIPVGDNPRTVAAIRDGRALVANYGDGTLSVVDLVARAVVATLPVGHRPYGVVAGEDEAYVSNLGDGTVSVIDLDTVSIDATLSLPDAPAGLALCGDVLLITHFFSGQVSVVDTSAHRLLGVVPTEADGNLARFVAVGPSGQRVYVPQTRSYASNEKRQFDSTLFPVVSVLALPDFSLSRRERITLDTADRPVNMPYAVAFSSEGEYIFVVAAGSNVVSVIDLRTNLAVASIEVGANPRGIVLSRDGRRAYVTNALDGTLSVIDVHSLELTETIPTTDIDLPPDVLRGKRLFYTSADPRLSTDSWISCNACHFDGGVDGRTWFFPDGPRNTPPLWLASETLPLHWSGTLDEIQDVELTIRQVMAGTGLIDGDANPGDGPPNAGRSEDLEALAAFIRSLSPPPSPFLRPDASLSESARRGRKVFMSRSGCSECHAPPLYTDLETHDLAQPPSKAEKRGMAFDTPTLRGLWATAPYMHDGRFGTLRDVFEDGDPFHNVAGELPRGELDDLINFLLSL